MKPLRYVRDGDLDYVIPVVQLLKNDSSIAQLKGTSLFSALKERIEGISDESLQRVLKEIALAS